MFFNHFYKKASIYKEAINISSHLEEEVNVIELDSGHPIVGSIIVASY